MAYHKQNYFARIFKLLEPRLIVSKTMAMAAVIVILIATGLYVSYQTNYVNQDASGLIIKENNQCPASCDDRVSCTKDYCNLDTDYKCTHVNTCTNPKCEDDTPFDSCSADQPLYCDFGQLRERCTICGCSDLSTICNDNNKSVTYNKCIETACLDDYDCNDYDASTKDECLNPYKILSNGSSGAECSYQLRALGTLNIAIVEFGQPGLKYGRTYHFCSEDKGYFVYQEDAWNTVKDTYCGSDLSLCNYTESFDYASALNDGDHKTIFDHECKIDKSSNSECVYYSLRYIEDWFSREAFVHNVNFGIDIDTFGPYETDSLPPYRTATENCNKLESYFDGQTVKTKIDLSNYDMIAYLYFTNTETGKRFEPCNTTDVYVSYSGADEGIVTASDLTKTEISIITEIMHRFGATGNVLVSTGPLIEDYSLTDKCAKEIGWD